MITSGHLKSFWLDKKAAKCRFVGYTRKRMLGRPSLQFVFDERKAAQAAAYLLHLNGGKMNYMVLIKLLYLADRQALTETEMPITGDHMVCMPHGPVLSGILDLINMGDPQTAESSPWFEYISEPSGYMVSLVQESTNLEELSIYELNVLQTTYEHFGGLGKWKLRDLTHKLPEWEDPQGSSSPIDIGLILESVGKSSTDIGRIKSEARELVFLASLK